MQVEVLSGAAGFTAPPKHDRLRLVEGTYVGAWELPGLGRVPAPTGVLIRPDSHVAWVGEGGTDERFAEAWERWFR